MSEVSDSAEAWLQEHDPEYGVRAGGWRRGPRNEVARGLSYDLELLVDSGRADYIEELSEHDGIDQLMRENGSGLQTRRKAHVLESPRDYLVMSTSGPCYFCGQSAAVRYFYCQSPGRDPRHRIAQAMSLTAAAVVRAFQPNKHAGSLEVRELRAMCRSCLRVGGRRRRVLRRDRLPAAFGDAFLAGENEATIARRFGVSIATVQRYVTPAERAALHYVQQVHAETRAWAGFVNKRAAEGAGIGLRTFYRRRNSSVPAPGDVAPVEFVITGPALRDGKPPSPEQDKPKVTIRRRKA